MARTSRPDSIWRVSLHHNAGHTYAATHPYTLDEKGKRKYSVIHWGTVTDDFRFIPGKRYLEATTETRRRLIFPDGWDLSALNAIASEVSDDAGRLPFRKGDKGKAFGAIWLLERVVGRTGLRADLTEVLGSPDKADDLLTLAYFPFLTGMSFQRFSRWQVATRTPSSRPLETMLADSLATVSRHDLRHFMELRRTRHAGERLCAVDSVTRHSAADAISDRRWGQKAERIHFQSTVEAVAYSLDTHIPVLYTSFPEAANDARGMGIFRAELAKAGLPGIPVITDRGYDSLQGLEPFFPEGPMVMCVDVKQPAVMQRIQAFGRFREHPAGMRYDAASRRWYRQYPMEGPGDLLLNLFFNPERRTAELDQIDAEITSQQRALQEIVDYGVTVADRRSLRHDYYLFNTVYDPERKTVASFTPDASRILSSRAASGFYANVTTGLSVGPLEAVSIYGLKYDQEKFLRQFRSLMDFPKPPARTEGLGLGVQILQYIALLLGSWLRHGIRTASAPFPYHSVMELLDEFHTIPCTEAGDGTCTLAPLSQSQSKAAELLGLAPSIS